MSQHLGRPSFANNAAAAVLAKAADFAPTPAGPGSRLGFASPGVHSRLPEGGTVTQRRTVGRTVGPPVYEDDDFRYNEVGATATARARGPTVTLGSVVLCALVAAAVALGTGLGSLASPAGADARALAARVTSVSASLDAMAKALAADAKRAAEPAKLDKAAKRELASLKEQVATLALSAQSDTRGSKNKNTETTDAKAELKSLKQELKTLVDAHDALAKDTEARVAAAALEFEKAADKDERRDEALADRASALEASLKALAKDVRDVKTDLETLFRVTDDAPLVENTKDGISSKLELELVALREQVARHEDEVRRKIEGWRGKPLVSPNDVETEVKRRLALATGADSTNKVDYALFSGGGRVVGHSALSPLVARAEGPLTHALKSIRGGVHPRADEWVLSGGANFAGECLALRGDKGFVDVRLREAVVVNAVTVEHVHADVAYDLSSAPKQFAVSGWNRTREPPPVAVGSGRSNKEPRSHDFGGPLRYELGGELRGATQTFSFDEKNAKAVDHVRFTVLSNYGNLEYTCLYRLRVHGTPVAKRGKVNYD
jgi:SUN domain-containing protein 1/2